MTNLILAIPEEMKKKMDSFPEMDYCACKIST